VFCCLLPLSSWLVHLWSALSFACKCTSWRCHHKSTELHVVYPQSQISNFKVRKNLTSAHSRVIMISMIIFLWYVTLTIFLRFWRATMLLRVFEGDCWVFPRSGLRFYIFGGKFWCSSYYIDNTIWYSSLYLRTFHSRLPQLLLTANLSFFQ